MNYDEIRNRYGLEFKEGNHKPNGNSSGVANDEGAIFLHGDYLGHVKDYDRQQKKGLDTDNLSGIKNLDGLKSDFTGSNFNTIWDAAGVINKRYDAPEEEEEKDPFQPRDKSEDHLQAEKDYLSHYEGGNPWAPSSAVESYNSAFNNAKEAGREMTAQDYLMQRADDKKSQVANRFMPYLADKNELARHEQHHAWSTALDRAIYNGVKPPELNDPYKIYEKYKKDLDEYDD